MSTHLSNYLSDEEIRNNILAEIHNRLAEISTYLKTGLAVLAKLDHHAIEELGLQPQAIELNTAGKKYSNYELFDNDSNIGFSSDKGLYTVDTHYKDKKLHETLFPLGEFERTAPIDKDTGAFINNAQEN